MPDLATQGLTNVNQQWYSRAAERGLYDTTVRPDRIAFLDYRGGRGLRAGRAAPRTDFGAGTGRATHSRARRQADHRTRRGRHDGACRRRYDCARRRGQADDRSRCCRRRRAC